MSLLIQKWNLRSPINKVLTKAMDTRVAAAFVHLWQTGGIVVTLGTEASEAVDPVNARAPVVAWIDGTVIDVNVTHGACKKIK